MDEDTLVKVENLSKKFTKSLRRSLAYGTMDIARSMVNIAPDTTKLRPGEFWVLDDINFELKRGEALGLIGMNGSGKSTLLRILTGIFPPDKGSITIRGRIGALISVGAGFHPNMSGRENIYLNGTILGMSRKEIDEKFDSIVDFADIGDFIQAPVATYSSGMNVRLGFAIAIHSVPELLLIDEILAVGDMRFQQKCMAKIGEIMKRGTSIILVSHQMANIQKICTKALLIHKSKQIAYGETPQVIQEYFRLNTEDTDIVAEVQEKKLYSSYDITYKYLKFFNSKGEETRKFTSGEDITAEFMFDVKEPLENVTFQLSLSDGPFTYNSYNTYYDNIKVDKVDDNTKIRIKLKDVKLSPGKFIVSIGIWDENFIGAYFWDYETPGFIEIVAGQKMQSRFEFQHQWEIFQNNKKIN